MKRSLCFLWNVPQRFKGADHPTRNRLVDTRISSGTYTQNEVTLTFPEDHKHPVAEVRQVESTHQASSFLRPTHFLALRIPKRSAALSSISEFYRYIEENSKAFSPLLIPENKLHLTLSVFYFSTPTPSSTAPTQNELSKEELGLAQHIGGALCFAQQNFQQFVLREEVVDRLRMQAVNHGGNRVPGSVNVEPRCGPFKLQFRGLRTFGSERVLFCCVKPEEDFIQLDAFIRGVRRYIGMHPSVPDPQDPTATSIGVTELQSNPNDSFVPHVTVAKIRPQQREEFGRTIPRSMWSVWAHESFGDATLGTVDLCAMKGASSDGYYRVLRSYKL